MFKGDMLALALALRGRLSGNPQHSCAAMPRALRKPELPCLCTVGNDTRCLQLLIQVPITTSASIMRRLLTTWGEALRKPHRMQRPVHLVHGGCHQQCKTARLCRPRRWMTHTSGAA